MLKSKKDEEKLEEEPQEELKKFFRSEVDETPASPKRVDGPFYSKTKWKGVQDIFKCAKCDQQLSNEDDMKLHVLSHYPQEDRDLVLDQLTKGE